MHEYIHPFVLYSHPFNLKNVTYKTTDTELVKKYKYTNKCFNRHYKR